MKAPLFILGIMLATLTARSQKLSAAERRRLFIADARDLPRLYEQKKLDSIERKEMEPKKTKEPAA